MRKVKDSALYHKGKLTLKDPMLILKIADLSAVAIERSAEVATTGLQLEVVGSCAGKEAVEMLKLLAETLHEGLLGVDGLEYLEVIVGNTGQVAVKLDSYMEVVNTGVEVESYSSTELPVMMVEVVTCGCMGVGDTGKLAVGVHCCTGIVVVESYSSMEVVNTCGMVLEI